jgi:hypothetical protein
MGPAEPTSCTEAHQVSNRCHSSAVLEAPVLPVQLEK